MAFLNDIFKVLALLLLLFLSVQPATIGLLQHFIQSQDYSQWYILEAIEDDLDLAALLQDDAIAHPSAVVFSVILALYINKYVQVCLYQIHLLVYEFSPAHTLWIVLENIWNFIYCTLSPVLMMRFTHIVAVRFLSNFCPTPYTEIISGVLAVCLLLSTFAITEQYVEYRTYEIEMMAIPPNLNPNNYGGDY